MDKRNKLYVGIATVLCGLSLNIGSVFADEPININRTSDDSSQTKTTSATTITNKDFLNYFSLYGGAKSYVEDGQNIVYLTNSKSENQTGAIYLDTEKVPLPQSFTLKGKVHLQNGPETNGVNSHGDGMLFGLTPSKIGSLGVSGNGVGFASLPNSYGFKIDNVNTPISGTYYVADPVSYNYAGFVNTDNKGKMNVSTNDIKKTSLIFYQSDDGHDRVKTYYDRDIQLDYDSKTKEMTVQFDDKTFTKDVSSWQAEGKLNLGIFAGDGTWTGEQAFALTSLTFNENRELKLDANDITIDQGEKFDPFDKRIGLHAEDSVDGDITDKIQVKSNDVDSSIAGAYHVTYQVVNSAGDVANKTITVTVKAYDPWPDGDVNGWKMFSGKDIELIDDPENSILDSGKTFYADEDASIYKIFNGSDSLKKGQKYRVTVYIKPLAGDDLNSHNVKVTLKADPSSNEYRELINTTLNHGQLGPKGYYVLTDTFTAGEGEENPLINIENFHPGYIGSVAVQPTE